MAKFDPPYKKLFSEAVFWEYGSIHTHEEIAEILGVKKNAKKYHSDIRRANEKLIESGKLLKNIRDIGYRIVSPDDYADVAIEHVDKSKMQISIAGKIIDHTPVKRLSPEGLKRHRQISDAMATTRAVMLGKFTELALLSKKQIEIRK